ncbi:MAG: MATE family efflux transporter [Muribaculaceae bacterium]|nr:MATE family efflux transporter [Muribaculaceae bacterium]
MGLLTTYGQYYRSIWRLALPLFIGQLGNIAVAFTDNIMVGQYSTDALASASFVNNFFNIAIFACVGFTYGLTPLIGAIFAGGDNDRIGRMVRVGLRVNTLFTIVLSLVMLVIYFNLDRMGQPEHLLPLIKPYYLIVLAGMLPVTVFNVFAQWSYAINNTGLPTWIVLGANAVNVLGNYLLIYGNFGFPELGLTGAGLSTFTARVLCAVAMVAVFFFCRQGRPFRHGFRHGRKETGETALVARTGFPVSMQMTFETASFSGSAVMAGWLGAIPLAAFQIVAVSGMLGFCLYYSIGAAMAIPLSHASGRCDYKAMRRIAYGGYHMILVCMVLVSVVFLGCGHAIMGFFSSDEAVVAAAMAVIVPIVLYQLGDATQIAFANALRGTSHVMPMLYIAFVSYIVVGLPVTYALAFPCGLGLFGIVLSFSVCLMMAAVLYLVFFIRATRTNK